MPRHAQGPRLYLRRGRIDRRTGKALPARYFIRDGASEIGTGCGPDRLREAEQALAEYIATKWTPPERRVVSRSDPAQVLVSEALALYAQERAPDTRLDPATRKRMIANLLDWWGERTLAEVKRSTCQAYAKHRCSQPNARYKDPASAPRVSSETARRELEILSGAIGYWHGEDTLTTRPEVWLPEKPESPRDALTRPQAARLMLAALGYRRDPATGLWKRLGASAVANRAHLRRFILIGLYTGTRHAVIRDLVWSEAPANAWADLDAGMIYRRGRQERDRANKKRPVVKLPPRLLAHMRRWQRLDEAAGIEANTVLHHGGHPIAGKIRTGFAGCVADAGLPAEITPHWMRHTAATWLMEADVDLWKAAGFLGMSSTTLEKHYGHHRPGYQEDAAGAFGKRA
jgi:integrase